MVCQDCLDLVLNVGKFALNYSKVSEMFLELGNVFDNEVDVVRNKYGFSSSLEHTNSEKDDPLFSSYVNYLKIDPAEGYSGCETEELYIVNAKNETNCGYDDNIYFKEEYDENSNENEDENVLYDEAIDVGAEFNHQNLLEYENSLKKRLPKKKSIRNMETDKLTYSCTLCNKILQRSSYERHMISCHSPTILQNFGCSICSKSFISKQSLMKHESVHLPEHLKKIIPCPHCGKKFRVRKNLAKHVQAVHAEKRPYICEECGKSFTQKTYLKQHHFTHATERLCKCPKCFKSFKNTAHLKKHMDIHNEDVHQCPECGKQLKTKRNLRAHMIVHSDQKKYDCPVCDLKFKRSDTLKVSRY